MRISQTRVSSGPSGSEREGSGSSGAALPVEWRARGDVARPQPEDEITRLAARLDVPPVVARLLWLRGVDTETRARTFLNPRLADLSPPEGLPNLDTATERLARALRSGERIAVCGDYDVDGMTGTALLVRFFRLAAGDAESQVRWAIPDRERDGYGLSIDAIERLAADDVNVIVTVDNGVTAVEPIRRAVELGIDVIITDHHLPGAEVPPALAILNPRLAAVGTNFDDAGAHDLCGCGLAFQLAWAVADRLKGHGVDPVALKAFLRDAIGLVALATVCDVVPLRGQNRLLVAAGLAAIRRSPHPGLQALLEVAEVGALPLTTEDVGFKLGPRLNAAGRLGKPELVIELLTADDAARARDLARELDAANQERRQIERGVLLLAEAEAQQLVDDGDPSALVVWGEGWHLGVVGIVAARLVDRFARPAVVIGLDGARGRGSCRTADGVDLHRALTDSAAHLGSYGGHAAAAGLDIAHENAPAFREAFCRAVSTQRNGAPPVRVIEFDAETGTDDWSLSLVEAIRRLAPFGNGNPEPVFVVRGAQVAGRPRLMGHASAHLSFALKQATGAIRVIGFRQSAFYDLAASGVPIDLAVTPMVNEWRGTRTPELRLLDMRSASPA
ncbi:MAG: single-stranded-DNA-specific exonuclease RecJ [Planctomycetota bacterium]|nr:single-stranded-DNA-specific exonuclease RecJ [Planctomycetota bacterium]